MVMDLKKVCKLKDENYLDLIPVRKCEHEYNNDLVTVLFIKKPTIIEKMFFRKMINKPYKIDLDEIGTFIWGQINTVLNVSEIIEITEEHFGDKVENAAERVIEFFRQMHSTKLIMLYEKVVEKE